MYRSPSPILFSPKTLDLTLSSMYGIIVAGAVILLLIILCAVYKKSPPLRENYGFSIGALGEYQALYYKCISDCEREDPSKYLGKTKGSLMCDAYCNSTITDMARRGGASYIGDSITPKSYTSYPGVGEFPPPTVKTRIDECYEQCGEGRPGYECRSNCACQGEVSAKCTQECAYSYLPKDACMDQCSKFYSVNCTSTSWTWK